MYQNSGLEAVCSISKMADKLNLSRPRFYQLLELGVFPSPVYCPFTKRPFYPLELQNRCLHIRQTGIGQNGMLVWFYSPRKRKNRRRTKIAEEARHFREFVPFLRELGIKATVSEVENAVRVLFPAGLPKDQDERRIVAALFKHFKPEHMNDV
jgi:hypothetical protein